MRDDDYYDTNDTILRVVVVLFCSFVVMSLAGAADIKHPSPQIKRIATEATVLPSYIASGIDISSSVTIGSIPPSPFDEINKRLDRIESEIQRLKYVDRTPYGAITATAVYPVYRYLPGCSTTPFIIENPIPYIATYTH